MTPTTAAASDSGSDYIPPNVACDECGADPGEPCLPTCTAPYGPGGPYEYHDPTGGIAEPTRSDNAE